MLIWDVHGAHYRFACCAFIMSSANYLLSEWDNQFYICLRIYDFCTVARISFKAAECRVKFQKNFSRENIRRFFAFWGR